MIKQAYPMFATGNVEVVLAGSDPTIGWNECKGMPFVKGDGIFRGNEVIVKNVFMNFPVYFDGINIEVNQIFGAEDKVVMVG